MTSHREPGRWVCGQRGHEKKAGHATPRPRQGSVNCHRDCLRDVSTWPACGQHGMEGPSCSRGGCKSLRLDMEKVLISGCI